MTFEYGDYYLAFVLGYDLLQKELSESHISECDLSFDYCLELVKSFKESEEYMDMSRSTYDGLRDWIDYNYEEIIKGMNQ